ncbi:competence protein ComG [Enterococcus sp. JM4C]|uniref:competence type IV pilus major pilin ComGC n=1 Tax=Candidatus Enterococcus huntleyi TaxID=1857217 RepID=UPI00192A5595|nr:competence protein ComG [Enterococcus sp. JM4C]
MITSLKKNMYRGFTLIEMLIVLLIISVLILLFVPNLSKHRDTVNEESNQAIVKVVETQMELYSIEKDSAVPDTETLLKEGYITKDQKEKYDKLHEVTP